MTAKPEGVSAPMEPTARELYDALAELEEMFARPDESRLDTFERVADAFYRDTGYLRPGKSEPLELGDRDAARAEAWERWTSTRLTRARMALARARGERVVPVHPDHPEI